MLRTFAQRLQHVVRDGIETVPRHTCDELVILVEDVLFKSASQVALAVLSAGSDAFPAVRGKCALGASIGVVVHKLSKLEEQLQPRVDAVMYAS